MSNILIPRKPAAITMETLPQLFAYNKARFGGWSMTSTPPEPGPNDPPAAPEKPEGITDQEWAALGDPGKAAIVREREARQAAERALAVSKAKPTPPKPADGPKPTDPPAPKKAEGDTEVDFEAIIAKAVTAAIKPFADRDAERDAESAASKIRDAVVEAAKDSFHDATDALTGIDLTQVTDGNGGADSNKIKTELEDLLKRKPHLGKVVDTRRHALPGAGAGGSAANIDDRVKDTLARMQSAVGIKPTQS